nr:SUMF1/EgtB/PvdO family nonheme iron enzyme [Desulfogranum marinum]
MAIGGAFQVENTDAKDWCYYIGKYEVTEDQLQVILKNNPEKKGSIFPANNISWFEVQEFIQLYNNWLYNNALKVIPKYGGVPGYIRLPTETEWEFAARGGSKVTSAEFDRKVPFPPDEITKHEWFAGPKSSHNKLKKIGILKPNALGIHDILGNVMEMTRSLYQIEYYQGRNGGFVAKGGHYLTNAKQLRSSLRTEQEFYTFDTKNKKVHKSKKATLGFRLLISSLVFPNRQISKQLKNDWISYRQGIAQSFPAAASTSATSNQTRIFKSDATLHLDRIKQELEQSGTLSNSLDQEISLLAVSLQDIQFTIQQAEKDSAYAWIKIAGEQAYFIYKESRKIPVLKKVQMSAEKLGRGEVLKKLKQREKEISLNIKQAMTAYTDSIRQLGTSSNASIEDGFSRYVVFLTKHNAQEQVDQLKHVRLHAEQYIKTKRTELETWKKELIDWPENSKI